MSIYFNAAKNRLLENLQGFNEISSEEVDGQESAVFSNENVTVKLIYSPETSRFHLLKRIEEGEYNELQSYYFAPSDDESADLKDAASVANEFCDTLLSNRTRSAVPSASRKEVKKERENDEASAIYFVNRIPTVLPECREPLIRHKEYYEMLLPNKFCDETVTAAVSKMLDDKTRNKDAQAFFDFLDKMYLDGGMDVKSIITMTILNNITGEARIARVEDMLSDDLAKAWKAARGYIGKEVKPAKESRYQKFSKNYRDRLENGAIQK